MANWDKITSRGNVEDRRNMAPVVGGIGLGGLALLIAFNLLTGGSLGDVLNQIDQIPTSQYQTAPSNDQYAGNDIYETFVSTVLGSSNDLWKQEFAQRDIEFTPPRLVLFRQATESECGLADSRMGPHYCPPDYTIYLDETFFDELTSRLGAKGGDVAQAYVIAHEAGHHAQNELGIMNRVNTIMEAEPDRQNELSVQLELQADCFAGLWAHSIKDKGVFELGEIGEAMDAAASVGDDRIQKKTTGEVNPETWTHGSADQRLHWFNTGYTSGDASECNTFSD